jgi:hypothetical protein
MTDLVAEAVREHWGEKCPDYSVGCYCCEAWKQYESLTARLAAAEKLLREVVDTMVYEGCFSVEMDETWYEAALEICKEKEKQP